MSSIEIYEKIVDNLFSKRFCLKSSRKKSKIITNGVDENLNSDESTIGLSDDDDFLLPDDPISLFLLRSSNSKNASSRDFNENEKKFDLDIDDHGGENFSSTIHWRRRLTELKRILNSTKDRLADKHLESWHDHTRRTNPTSIVVGEVRRRFRPDCCTQAWCKFYEILAAFPRLVGGRRGRLRSLHLCEAPGAFVNALSYYVRAEKLWINDWDWRANTLNPYYEGNAYDSMIGDDRFIFHTSARWMFGAEDTGDLTEAPMLDTLIKTFGGNGGGGKADLVTADGSIDCQDDPNEQEGQLLPLHYCETVSALYTLAVGGNFVLKRFTMLERPSIALLYLICCVFEEVTLFKPATSKSGNSETYIVCESYKGLSEEYLSKLRALYGRRTFESSTTIDGDAPADHPSSFPSISRGPQPPSSNPGSNNSTTINNDGSRSSADPIPVWFLRATYEAQKFFVDHQTRMVEFNMATFRNWTPELQSICDRSHTIVLERFLRSTGLAAASIDQQNQPPKPPIWIKNIPWQKRGGTCEQRRSSSVVVDGRSSRKFIIQELTDEIGVFRDKFATSLGGGCGGGGGDDGGRRSYAIRDYSCPLFTAEWYENEKLLEPVYGRRIVSLVNSKMCHGGLLAAYLSIREIYDQIGGDSVEMIPGLNSLELCQFVKTSSTFSTKPRTIGGDAGDCHRIDLDTDDMSKLEWLDFLISLITEPNPPPHLEFARRRFVVLTRFSANVLVVLCACYERVTLSLSSIDSSAGPSVIKLENRRAFSSTTAQNFVSYLRRVKYGLAKRERQGSTMDLMQFLPVEYLADPAFYTKLQKLNDSVLLQTCQEMLSTVSKTTI